ncbi:hypothetical protein [Colwellia echini]|uniref:Sugar porter family MFS transporter n=1 Tax=Colwellia echini TaxID=1982103 RepID=A0ABY3MUH6_9GAMM|nr:hypothetical protein [Colwellia echini]TYK64844.1 sugar porter family MFS transporter [Colwellia echini]
MTDERLVLLLKICIGIGICLLILGVYLQFFSTYIDSLGVTGIILHASCIALGMIFSLPTKIYLTFLLMKMEADANEHAHKKAMKSSSLKTDEKV